MLYIDFGGAVYDCLGHPDYSFDLYMQDSWFDDPVVKQIVKDIDDADVISAYAIKHPVFKAINYSMLSSTCRSIILMYKLPDEVVNATYCGEKGSDWVLRLSEKRDVKIVLNYAMLFNRDFNAIIANGNEHIVSRKEYYACALKYLYEAEG